MCENYLRENFIPALNPFTEFTKLRGVAMSAYYGFWLCIFSKNAFVDFANDRSKQFSATAGIFAAMQV